MLELRLNYILYDDEMKYHCTFQRFVTSLDERAFCDRRVTETMALTRYPTLPYCEDGLVVVVEMMAEHVAQTEQDLKWGSRLTKDELEW